METTIIFGAVQNINIYTYTYIAASPRTFTTTWPRDSKIGPLLLNSNENGLLVGGCRRFAGLPGQARPPCFAVLCVSQDHDICAGCTRIVYGHVCRCICVCTYIYIYTLIWIYSHV